MKVQDCMTSPARSCTTDASLVTAARIMWDYKVGALPVLDAAGHPVGMVTDRDICMAAARKGRFAGDISVRETMSPNPFTIQPGDDLSKALDTMSARQVRRLPVVDSAGHLVGILSINDAAAAAESGDREFRGRPEVFARIVATLRKIASPSATPGGTSEHAEDAGTRG
ncbi:MAG: CBS domain-containing protein [Acidobacteriota bacterium]